MTVEFPEILKAWDDYNDARKKFTFLRWFLSFWSA